jgi:hypothetical protein
MAALPLILPVWTPFFSIVLMDYNTPFSSSAALEDTVFVCDSMDVFSYFGFSCNDDLTTEYLPLPS